jgi:NitT/TauT family transport system ATP-binding protein
MIEFKNVIFNYDQHLVFKNFNVKFVSQKINCIIGPSAVGKSTLLNLVAKIINPLKGQIINPDHNISYLFQEERLIDEITVYKNLDLILKSVYLDINKRRQLIEVGLKSVELSDVGS